MHLGRRAPDHLTPREREVLALVCRGMLHKEMAAALSVSPDTIKNQVHAINRKLGTRSMVELVIHVARHRPGAFAGDGPGADDLALLPTPLEAP
jgi:DNA-binding NarL/FixJ family response regulator